MAQPFDVTLKHLLEAHPADCLRLAGITTTAAVDVIDADLATVMAEADKVLRVHDPEPWLMHFELQVSYDANLPRRMLRYNVLLNLRHDAPVRSTVILLRPRADGPEMTGTLRQYLDGRPYLEFNYQIMRIWQTPVTAILAGGLGTLPLAPLAAVEPSELPAVIQRMHDRVSKEATRSEQATLWTATYLLMGLRYDRETISQLLKGVVAMEESITYQEIIGKGLAAGMAAGKAEGAVEGAIQEAQRILQRLGTTAFGEPDAATHAAVEEIRDRDQLEDLIVRVGSVKSWAELLAAPTARPRRGGTKKRKGR